jgi:Fe(3+) dicitrate transport protein
MLLVISGELTVLTILLLFRNLLKDQYRNMGAEIRFLQRYRLMNLPSHFLIGTRVYKGLTIRKQGDADKTDKAHFTFLNPDNLENSSYQFPSENLAIFSENIFQITSKWNLTPGLRFEYINTSSEGYYRLLNRDLAGNVLLDKTIQDNRSNARTILLAGIGTQYKLTPELDFYVNASQNYRSINFNDMRVVNPNFQVNPDLKDESGFTLDGGFRGVLKDMLYFDFSAFYLFYNNRIGTVLKVDSLTYQIVRYRTNVSDSRNSGVELFTEFDWVKLFQKQSAHKFSTFINTSYINAVYVNSEQTAFRDKLVEYVPKIIFRSGFNYAWKNLKLTCQYSYTDAQYSDATNAETSPSAIYGRVPAYQVVDFVATYTYKMFSISAGINNALNEKYFTRRAEGYPGPGIIPADPRNFFITLQYKF